VSSNIQYSVCDIGALNVNCDSSVVLFGLIVIYELMQIFLYILVILSISRNSSSSFSLNTRSYFRGLQSKKSYTSLSAKPVDDISSKMSKIKVKAESTEVDYDISRSSGFVLQGLITISLTSVNLFINDRNECKMSHQTLNFEL
jgi:hypothetical protein